MAVRRIKNHGKWVWQARVALHGRRKSVYRATYAEAHTAEQQLLEANGPYHPRRVAQILADSGWGCRAGCPRVRYFKCWSYHSMAGLIVWSKALV